MTNTQVSRSRETPRYVDISAGQGPGSGHELSMVLDEQNQKLLVVGRGEGPQESISLFRCELDGTRCKHTDLSLGHPERSGRYPRAAIDSQNRKLFVLVAQSPHDGRVVNLLRCELDGSNCAAVSLPHSGEGSARQAAAPAGLALDHALRTMMILAHSGGEQDIPVLYRCALDDGSRCVLVKLTQAPRGTAWTPELVIDAAGPNRRVLAVATAPADQYATGLFTCSLEVTAPTGCAYRKLSTPFGPAKGHSPRLALDLIHKKLLFVAQGFAVGLLRCELDGSGCTEHDFSADRRSWIDRYLPDLVVDTARSSLYVVSTDQRHRKELRVDTCPLRLDRRSRCHSLPSATGPQRLQGLQPNAILDSQGNRLLVAFTDPQNGDRPALLIVPLPLPSAS